MITKRKLLLFVGLLALFLGVLPGYAQSEVISFEGQVIEIGPETRQIVLETSPGVIVWVTAPESFDLDSIANGDTIFITAQTQEDGTILALSIELVSSPEDEAATDDADDDKDDPGTGDVERKGADEAGDGEDGEGEKDGKMNSAYCAEDKQDKPHPFLGVLIQKFGDSVSENWVMENFCEGVGMGQIMLALLTDQKTDGASSAEDVLDARIGGSGWGQIWKVLGLVGPERNSDGDGPPGLADKEDKHPDGPPGLQNKPDNAGKKSKPDK